MCQELATPGSHYRRPKTGVPSTNVVYANGGGSWRAAPRQTQRLPRQTVQQYATGTPATGSAGRHSGRAFATAGATEVQTVEFNGAAVMGLPATPRTTKQARNKSEGKFSC